MKNEMKDEDLEKVSGGWTIAKNYFGGDIAIQHLTGLQMGALSDLLEELGLEFGFGDDSCVFDMGDDEDPACGRCDISARGFNDETFARIKQVLGGEPDGVYGFD